MDRVPQDAVVGLALSLGHALQTRLTFEHFVMEIRELNSGPPMTRGE